MKSLKLSSFENKIPEYVNGESEVVGRLESEDRLDANEKLLIDDEFGFVGIGIINRMCLRCFRCRNSLGRRVPMCR
jgi:hypothetical protein